MIVGILMMFIATPVEAHMGHSFPTAEWIQRIRESESKQNRIPISEMLNNSLLELEWNYGSDDPTEQEELLQL